MHDANVLDGEKSEKSGNWFQNAFATVSSGFGLFDAFKNRQSINNGLDEGKKQTDIDYLLLSAFFDNEITDGVELKTAIDKAVQEAKNQGSLHYDINANDVLARYAVMADDDKAVLQSASKSNDWEAVYGQWESRKSEQQQDAYLGSEKFQTDQQAQIDHLLNERMGTDLGSLSENEQAEFIQFHLESSGIGEGYNITLEDVLARYEVTGQKLEQAALET